MDDELLARFIRGSTTPAEHRAVRDWLAAAPANAGRLRQLRQLLHAVVVADPPPPRSDPPDTAEIIRRAERRTDARRRWSWRIGAVAAAAAVIAAVSLTALRTDRVDGFVFGAGEFVTGNQAATVQLGDGSVVRLAPASRLRVDGRGGHRRVRLDGRGYFAVAKMNGRPFQVETGSGLVTVLGTQFDLQAGTDSLALVVVEGRVALAVGAQQATVDSGQATEVRRGQMAEPIPVTDVAQRVAWAGNFLVFQSASLARVADEIARHYGVKVRIADPALAGRTVTAWLSDRSLADALEVVCTIADADCVVADSTVTVRPR